MFTPRNPQIIQWMNEHPNITSYAELEAYYELNLLNILNAQGTDYICWQVGLVCVSCNGCLGNINSRGKATPYYDVE